MKKYFVVSDIHGYFTILKEALDENGFDIENPNHILIVAGDIIDRGQEAVKTVLFLLSIPEERLIFIRGNHEDLMEHLLEQIYNFEMINFAHMSNKTLDSVVQFTRLKGIDLTTHNYEPGFIKHKMKIFTELLERAVDYYEIDDYIIVHGWVPVKQEEDGRYKYNKDWRNASKDEWDTSRWLNGMKLASEGIIEEGKTIICGHYHTSFGNYNYHNKGSGEFTKDADFGIYKDKGIIAIDAATAHSKKINVYIFEK